MKAIMASLLIDLAAGSGLAATSVPVGVAPNTVTDLSADGVAVLGSGGGWFSWTAAAGTTLLPFVFDTVTAFQRASRRVLPTLGGKSPSAAHRIGRACVLPTENLTRKAGCHAFRALAATMRAVGTCG